MVSFLGKLEISCRVCNSHGISLEGGVLHRKVDLEAPVWKSGETGQILKEIARKREMQSLRLRKTGNRDFEHARATHTRVFSDVRFVYVQRLALKVLQKVPGGKSKTAKTRFRDSGIFAPGTFGPRFDRGQPRMLRGDPLIPTRACANYNRVRGIP